MTQKTKEITVDLGADYTPVLTQHLVHERIVLPDYKPGNIDYGAEQYLKDGGRKIHKPDAKILVFDAGRGWGKGLVAVKEFYDIFLRLLGQERPIHLHPKVLGWGMAPTFRVGKPQWMQLKHYAPNEITLTSREDEKDISFLGDGFIEQRSWEDMEGQDIEAVRLDVLWVTEATRLPDKIWHNQISPMLHGIGREGIAILESKARPGAEWFYELLERGKDPDEPTVASWHFTVFDNPLIDKEEILAEQEHMPELAWRQEYLAEHLEHEPDAFTHINPNFVPGDFPKELFYEPAEEGTFYSIGVDLAKQLHYFAIVVMDAERRRVKYFERLRKADYVLQKAKILEVFHLYPNSQVRIDKGAGGEAVIDDLRYEGRLPVIGVAMSGQEKHRLYTNLLMALEKENIRIPSQYTVIKEELKHIRRETSQFWGFDKWHAKQGHYDDAVDALTLALDGCQRASLQHPGLRKPSKARQTLVRGIGSRYIGGKRMERVKV